jgi:hypothetical protein
VTTVLVVLVLLVVSAVIAATVVVRNNKRTFAEANVVVPGTTTKAPAAWAGAHSPEARMHRRLRDAVAALRANPAMEDAFMMDARVSLEQQALAVDERLIAVAALPEPVRAEPLASVAAAVDAVEAAVAALATGPGERSRLDRAMADVADRVAQLEQGGTV